MKDHHYLDDFAVGDVVNYHEVIGGPVTSTGHKIKHIEIETKGMKITSAVALITWKRGCVPMDALTPVKSKITGCKGEIMFKVGDKVTWSSQAQGSTKEKTGKIIKVLKRIKNSVPLKIADQEFPNHHRMFDGWNIPGKADVGYFVEVITGPKAKPRLYMPYPSKLKAAKEG